MPPSRKKVWSLLIISGVLLFAGGSLAAPGNWRLRLRERLQKRPEMASQMQRYQVTVNGLQRHYYLYQPPQASLNQPLLIGLHGGKSKADRFAETTGFNELANREGFAVAYPEGIDKQWNDGRNTPSLPQQDDIAFLRAVVNDVDAKLTKSSKTREVYVTGISNGGFMAQRAACELSDRITAVASVASTMAEATGKTCQPQKPVAVLLIGSPDDKFIPWQGGEITVGAGGKILSMDDTIKGWQQRLGCDAANINELPDRAQDGTKVTISRSHCRDQAQVNLVKIDGGGHTWPQGQNQPERLLGKVSQEFNASQYIWQFFQGKSTR
jgi:polyhydroxybutyrate depolymerase